MKALTGYSLGSKSSHKRPTLTYDIISGLDFLLNHFKPKDLFPRSISTKLTENKQITVYNRFEVLEHFAESELKDCKISAFHSMNWRKGLSKLVEPDFLFIDLFGDSQHSDRVSSRVRRHPIQNKERVSRLLLFRSGMAIDQTLGHY